MRFVILEQNRKLRSFGAELSIRFQVRITGGLLSRLFPEIRSVEEERRASALLAHPVAVNAVDCRLAKEAAESRDIEVASAIKIYFDLNAFVYCENLKVWGASVDFKGHAHIAIHITYTPLTILPAIALKPLAVFACWYGVKRQ